MGRTGRDRGKPHLPPVEHIELNEEHLGRRLIAAGVFLVLGAVLLVRAVMGLLSPETGWQTIQAGSGGGLTCGDEFAFLYEGSSAAEIKGVTALYTSACQKAVQLFYGDLEFEDVTNVYTMNRSPNQTLEVDEALYRAFQLAEAQGSRALYLGPVYDRYEEIFSCQEDYLLADYDPWSSEDVGREYQTVADYANDPRAITLELLGENRVCLRVSQEYLDYTRREGITELIGFGWMRNAFIADYLAGELMDAGYTSGSITSYDGFIRNLDGSGTSYSLNLFDRQGNTVYPAATMKYQGPVSMITLHNYPLNQLDSRRFYELENGEIRTFYVDTRDGRSRTAVNNLVCYSREKGCAQLAMEIGPVYIADELREEALRGLAGTGTESIYCRDGVIYHTEGSLILSDLYSEDGVRYRAEVMEP